MNCSLLQLLLCGIADSTRRGVDDSAQSFIVVGIGGDSEISHSIFHLLALIERQSAIDGVGNIALAQSFLKHARLCICAVKYGKIIKRATLARLCVDDVVSHGIAFLKVGVRLNQLYEFSGTVIGEDILWNLLAVLGNKAVSSLNNVLSGAIVLLKLESENAGVIFLEVENIADVSTSE